VVTTPISGFGAWFNEDPIGAIEVLGKSLHGADLTVLMQALPADMVTGLKAGWAGIQGLEPNPQRDAMLDLQLQILNSPDATAIAVAQLQEQMGNLPAPAELAGQLQMVGLLLQVQMNQDEELAEAGELTFIRDILPKIQNWAQDNDLRDPNKAEQAAVILVEAIHAVGVNNAEALRALDFDQLLQHGGGLVTAIKKALALYDLDPDPLLASLKVTELESPGDGRRLIELGFKLFGEDQVVQSELVEKDGAWYSKTALKLQELLGQLGAAAAQVDTSLEDLSPVQ
jgi:hypothetical protein